MLLKDERKSFTEGSLFFKITLFALPIALTSMLQVLYSVGDNVIIGRYSGDLLGLPAIASTNSIISLIINLLVGVSAGTSVVVAQAYGTRDGERVSRATHTSIAFAALFGVVMCIIGLLISSSVLVAIGTKPELLSRAELYMKIICIGMPASAVMNFGAAVLRSTGDSKTPMVVFALSGLANLLLNMLFVVVFSMSVQGVAIATVLSQYGAAAAILLILALRRSESYAFRLDRLRIDPSTLIQVLRCGVPAAIQTVMYSVGNIFIAVSINKFATTNITASVIVGNIDGITYLVANSYLNAAMTITAQNYGARKFNRARRVVLYSFLQTTVVGIAVGQIILMLADPIMSFYVGADDPNRLIIFEQARELLAITLTYYFLCGIQEAISGALRGLGHTIAPAIISVLGICGVRIIWVLTFFNLDVFHSMVGLYLAYPLSWGLTALMLAVLCLLVLRKLPRGGF